MRYIEPVVVRAAPKKWIFICGKFNRSGAKMKHGFLPAKTDWTFAAVALDFANRYEM
jgi:hypothetical protein